MEKVCVLPWKAVSLEVELDLSEYDGEMPWWQAVRLLFVWGLKELVESVAGKKG